MRCLIVGTDRLGAAPKVLRKKLGISEVIHWNGRRKKHPDCIPSGVQLILLYSGFVSHSLMWRVRELAKKTGVQMLIVNRGLSELGKCS